MRNLLRYLNITTVEEALAAVTRYFDEEHRLVYLVRESSLDFLQTRYHY